jgi:geranylgeranyl diphosphate synthase type I
MVDEPALLRALREDVDRAVAVALDGLSRTLTSIDGTLAPLVDALVDLASQGKRLRPALLVIGHDLAGGGAHADVMGPAVAVELVHTCALIHDDVIDRAALRRGRPTVHERFAAAHRAAGSWRGDADDYGRSIAILLGDVVLAAADGHLLDARVGAEALRRAFHRFTTLRIEVMAGQVLDLDAATTGIAGPERALTVAMLKSGRYTVARPLEIGASLAGADDALVDALGRVGDPLGVAFQLRDDVLGLFGDPATTGKAVGADIAEGKRTLLVAEALARLAPPDAARLEQGLADADLEAGRAAELTALIASCGAREAVEARIEDALARADAALDDLTARHPGVREDAVADLRTLATYLVGRHA